MGLLDYTSRIPPLQSDHSSRGDVDELAAPDRRDGRLYDCEPELQLAVEVALTTGRPLLLRGSPGSGKSSLAAFVARNLGWRYYDHVVTSTTRARDLLWRFDAVRRLSDAQARRREDPLPDDHRYFEPGVLWWAFDPESARRRGAPADTGAPRAVDPGGEINETRDQGRAVVLIDELDKADPDVPNGLLVPLASISFRVEELGVEVTRSAIPAEDRQQAPLSPLLVVITTNEERDLPPAFLRRCVDYTLPDPDWRRLATIGRLHLGAEQQGELGPEDLALLETLAKRVEKMRDQARERAERPPSTAEYLDAVRACRALGIEVGGSQAWEVLQRATLGKRATSQSNEA